MKPEDVSPGDYVQNIYDEDKTKIGFVLRNRSKYIDYSKNLNEDWVRVEWPEGPAWETVEDLRKVSPLILLALEA